MELPEYRTKAERYSSFHFVLIIIITAIIDTVNIFFRNSASIERI